MKNAKFYLCIPTKGYSWIKLLHQALGIAAAKSYRLTVFCIFKPGPILVGFTPIELCLSFLLTQRMQGQELYAPAVHTCT